MTDTRFNPEAMAMQQEWVWLAKDYLNDKITKEEFEKRKRALELKGMKITKVHTAGEAPAAVKAAVNKFNGSAKVVEPHVERGFKPDDDEPAPF